MVFTASTTAIVEAVEFLRIGMKAARKPLMRTTFVCCAKLSLTLATSLSMIGIPSRIPIGSSLNCSTNLGLELSWMLYSFGPSRAMPAGMITLAVPKALTTSICDSPLELAFAGSTSTMIWRCLPPNAPGIDNPGMVNNRTRRNWLA